MTMEEELFLSLLDQGIDPTEIGVAYARRAYPDLDTTAPIEVYSRGFFDGIKAFQALLPLLHEGPNHDPAEFWRRLYDPDVLPVAGT